MTKPKFIVGDYDHITTTDEAVANEWKNRFEKVKGRRVKVSEITVNGETTYLVETWRILGTWYR